MPDSDILIIGSGFGGSLMALVAKQIGLRPVLIDRGRHPRFAIGESTTPLANLILERLAKRYHLPRLAPLANYASWRAAYPEVMRGLKRGFSYFTHNFGEEYQPHADHSNELLVAASYAAADADTHWVRADVDQFLAREAMNSGVPLFEDTTPESLQHDAAGWTVNAVRDGEPLQFCARFLVDASGAGGWLARQLGLSDITHTLHTHSRAVFAHFRGLTPWETIYRRQGGDVSNYPFPCDAAAVHHVFDGGWMYQLPFDNGVTSAGFALDPRCFPEPADVSPDDEWAALLRRFPSIAEQFASAEPVSHGGRLARSRRLQRRFSPAAGADWALLPHAAGFLDPLQSTGIAHTMFGIERLAEAWEKHWPGNEEKCPDLSEATGTLAAAMTDYDRLFQLELSFVDLIVAGSYRSFHDFPRMVALTMFYFASAIWSEHQRRTATTLPSAFLCADDPVLRAALQHSFHALNDATVTTAELTAFIAQAIAPFNLAGLCDPAKHNMYPYTA